jgi:hypothetical protein
MIQLVVTSSAQRLALAASGRDTGNARKRNPAEALKTAKKRGDSHLSAAPSNDSVPSFSTKERLAVWTKDGPKVRIFREKDAFWAISGCRSENAVLGVFVQRLTHF